MRWPFVSRARYEAIQELSQQRHAQACRAEAAVEHITNEKKYAQHVAQRERDRYDAATADYNAHLKDLQANYLALLDKYHALRVQGAVVPEPKPQISPAKPQGPIAEAIDEVCARYGNSVKLRRRLMKYAEDMKRSDGEDAEIAHAILHWKSPDDEEDAA